MALPCVLARGDGARGVVVEKLGILSEAPPEAKLLAGIVALVDQVGLVGVGIVTFDEGLDGAFPRVLFEGAPFPKAKPDTFAERPEEGGFVRRRPAEPRATVLAWSVRWRACGGKVFVCRHDGPVEHDEEGPVGWRRRGRGRGRGLSGAATTAPEDSGLTRQRRRGATGTSRPQ